MSSRIKALDSLRGLASLQVTLGHLLVAIPAYHWIVYDAPGIKKDFYYYVSHSPLHFFVSASPAVIIFFVLSGYVLSLPYYAGKKNPEYIPFFIKRVLRLYLPCITAVLISIFIKDYFYDRAVMSSYDTWAKVMWSENDKSINWGAVFSLNTNVIDYYIPSAWTLPIELKLSLILPFYILLLKKLTPVLSALSVPFFLILVTLLGKTSIKAIIPDYTLTYYLTFFLMGSVLCKYRTSVLSFINGLSLITYLLLFVFVLCIFTIDYNNRFIPAFLKPIESKIEQYIIGFTAAFFIVFALSERAILIMNNKILLFLGKISFSLYLVHQLIMVIIILTLHNYISSSLILVLISIIMSVFGAEIFYKYIEVPSIYISRKVSDKMTGFIKQFFVYLK